MKKVILFAGILFIGFSAQSQEKLKNAKISMEVNGVCEMCKSRIEKASIKIKGVKSASWDVETHILSLIIDENKVTKEVIHQKIADIGHDTKLVRATDEAYNSLHGCCKYDREESN